MAREAQIIEYDAPLLEGLMSVTVDPQDQFVRIEAGEAFFHFPVPRNFNAYLADPSDPNSFRNLPRNLGRVFAGSADTVYIEDAGGEMVEVYRNFDDFLVQNNIPLDVKCIIRNANYME
eukprot:gene25158-30380_t